MKIKNNNKTLKKCLVTILLLFMVFTGTNLVQAKTTDYNAIVDKANKSLMGNGLVDPTISKQISEGIKKREVSFDGVRWSVTDKGAKKSGETSNTPENTEAPKAQQAKYNADEIQNAVKNANANKATTKDNEILTYGTTNQIVQQNEKGEYTAVNTAPTGTWTLFAELLMSDPDAKQKWSVLGKGDVSAELPYSTISKQGNKLTSGKNSGGDSGNKAGTKTASTLATLSYYNYFKSLSGNSIALGADSAISFIFRIIGGAIAITSAGINSLFHNMNKIIGEFLVTFNPYSIMWSTASTVVSKNILTQAVVAVLQGLGFTKGNLQIIFSISFLIITGFFAFRLMRNLQNGITGQAIFDPTKKWVVRIIPVFFLLPLFSLCSGYLLQNFTASEWGNNNGAGITYLVNDRYWSASSNLSPSGGLNGTAPYATSKKNYIDDSYAPFKATGKANITNINRTAYAWNRGVEVGDLSDEEISTDLIIGWMANQTFNVNTWASDVQISDTDGSARTSKATVGADSDRQVVDDDKGKWSKGKKDIADANELDTYVWSVAQNPDDTQKDPMNYNSKLQVGSADGNSFSTQSVALLLQSHFDETGAKFYAYNISPTGAQKSMKNLSTVKTEWKSVQMVGSTGLGQISSYVGLVGGYLSLLMINFGIFMALWRTGILDALLSFIKSLVLTVLYGDPVEAIATFAYFVAMLLVGIMSMSLGGVIYKAIDSAVTGLNTLITWEWSAGLISALVQLFVAYLVAINDGSKKGGIKDHAKIWQNDYSVTLIGRMFNAILEQAHVLHTQLRMFMPTMQNSMVNAINNRGYYSNAEGGIINPYAHNKGDDDDNNWTRNVGDWAYNKFRGNNEEDDTTNENPTSPNGATPQTMNGETNTPPVVGGYGSSDNGVSGNDFRLEKPDKLSDDDFRDNLRDDVVEPINQSSKQSDDDTHNMPSGVVLPRPATQPIRTQLPTNVKDDFGSPNLSKNATPIRPHKQMPSTSNSDNGHDEINDMPYQEPTRSETAPRFTESNAIYNVDNTNSREDFKNED